MNNKTIILIGIIVILLAVVIGGGIGLINSEENPLGITGLNEKTFTIISTDDSFGTYTIEKMLASNTYAENYLNLSRAEETNETIKWLKGFDNSKYTLITADEGVLIIENSEFEQLEFPSTERDWPDVKLKANVIETHFLGITDIYYINNPKITDIKHNPW